MTDDLIPWLRAQLDDDERVARTAGGDAWRYSDSGIYHEDAARRPGPFAAGPYGYLDEEEGDHIARHDPARVLAEVDAKRRILDWLEEEAAFGTPAVRYSSLEVASVVTARTTIKMLALPYADHPGYREEWRP